MTTVVLNAVCPPEDLTQNKIERWGCWSVVLAGFFIPISTVLMNVFFGAAGLCCLLSQNYRTTLKQALQIRTVFLATLLCLYLAGSLFYSTASHHFAYTTLLAYSKLIFIPLLIPLLQKDCWRHRALLAFLAAMLITLAVFYAKTLGMMLWHFPWQTQKIFKYYITTNLFMAFACYVWALVTLSRFADERYAQYRLANGLLFLALIFNILFMSDGRAGYVVFLCLFLYWFWQQFGFLGIAIAAIAAVGLLISAFFVSAHFSARLQQVQYEYQAFAQTGDTTTSIGKRLMFYQSAIKLIEEHPIIGTGVGSFPERYANLHPPASAVTDNPHNEYLNASLQIGIIGLILLCALFYFQWRDSRYLTPFWAAVNRGLVLAIVIGSTSNSWLLDAGEGHFYVFFTALAFFSFGRGKTFDYC